mmetsp:Transcript_529/g.2062  ORF Transcript_529/g.2062 Transcript_529/m.2062 type:complete len:211 (+) Transcript_529:1277-1909(+)
MFSNSPQSLSSFMLPPDICTRAHTVMQKPLSGKSMALSTHFLRANVGSVDFSTYTLGGSALVRACRAAPVFFATVRVSSFISYPNTSRNLICALATMYPVKPLAGDSEDSNLLTSARNTGAPSLYWLNSIKRITSDTRASLSSLLMRVMTACVSKDSSWVWYTWVICTTSASFGSTSSSSSSSTSMTSSGSCLCALPSSNFSRFAALASR